MKTILINFYHFFAQSVGPKTPTFGPTLNPWAQKHILLGPRSISNLKNSQLTVGPNTCVVGPTLTFYDFWGIRAHVNRGPKIISEIGPTDFRGPKINHDSGPRKSVGPNLVFQLGPRICVGPKKLVFWAHHIGWKSVGPKHLLVWAHAQSVGPNRHWIWAHGVSVGPSRGWIGPTVNPWALLVVYNWAHGMIYRGPKWQAELGPRIFYFIRGPYWTFIWAHAQSVGPKLGSNWAHGLSVGPN